jgi:hypothetical protein
MRLGHGIDHSPPSSAELKKGYGSTSSSVLCIHCHVTGRPLLNTQLYTLRSALFWEITQDIEVVIYRRFGTPFLSSVQELFTLEDGTDMLSRNVTQECLNMGRVGYSKTSVKICHCTLRNFPGSADLIYFMAVTWYHALTRTDCAWISIWEITQNYVQWPGTRESRYFLWFWYYNVLNGTFRCITTVCCMLS